MLEIYRYKNIINSFLREDYEDVPMGGSVEVKTPSKEDLKKAKEAAEKKKAKAQGNVVVSPGNQEPKKEAPKQTTTKPKGKGGRKPKKGPEHKEVNPGQLASPQREAGAPTKKKTGMVAKLPRHQQIAAKKAIERAKELAKQRRVGSKEPAGPPPPRETPESPVQRPTEAPAAGTPTPAPAEKSQPKIEQPPVKKQGEAGAEKQAPPVVPTPLQAAQAQETPKPAEAGTAPAQAEPAKVSVPNTPTEEPKEEVPDDVKEFVGRKKPSKKMRQVLTPDEVIKDELKKQKQAKENEPKEEKEKVEKTSKKEKIDKSIEKSLKKKHKSAAQEAHRKAVSKRRAYRRGRNLVHRVGNVLGKAREGIKAALQVPAPHKAYQSQYAPKL